MEPDRFQHSPTVYTIGLISMISSMALFGLGAYALPNIAFGLTYRIPEFIFYWINLIHLAYGFTEKKAGLLVLMIIFALGFIASVITYAVSNRIESEMYAIKVETVNDKNTSKEWRESGPLILKIVLIMILIFISAKLFQWAISIQ